jgi:hypothetical protein
MGTTVGRDMSNKPMSNRTTLSLLSRAISSLSDEQLNRVLGAAALLPDSRRDVFIMSVAGRVAGLRDMGVVIGMAEISSAIRFVLNNYGVAPGKSFKMNYNPKGIFQ